MTMGAVKRIKELTDPWRPVNGEPDLRGWEWYYLRSRLHQDLWTLRLPEETVDADLNSDLTQLATHDGKTIRLWDSTTGQQLKSKTFDDAEVLSIAWHPDGMRLAISLMDEQNSIQVWHCESDGDLTTVCSSRWPVGRLWWSGDGFQLACASQEGISIFDFGNADAFPRDADCVLPVDFSSIARNQPPNVSVRDSAKLVASWSKSIALSPNWRQIATHAGSRRGDRSRNRIDISNIEPEAQHSSVESIWFARGQWSPDGKFLASAITHNLQVWDVSKHQVHGELSGHLRAVSALAWSPDSMVLASAGDDFTIRLWDTEEAVQRRVLQGHTDRVVSLWWNEAGDRLASASDDHTIKFWAAANDGQPPRVKERRIASAWSPTNEPLVLAIAGQGGEMIGWDADADSVLWTMNIEGGSSRAVSFSPDGKYLSKGQSGQLQIFEVATGKLWKELRSPTGDGPSWVEWSPDGKYLATTAGDGIELWNVGQMERDQVQEPEQLAADSDYRTLAWSRGIGGDKLFLAAGTDSGSIKIWDINTRAQRELRGQSKLTGQGQNTRAMALTWSPDGQLLVSGGDEGIFIWDVPQGRQFTLEGHTNGVQYVDFSPDGKRIASCSSDSTVKVWDAHSGNEVLTLTGHKIFVRSVKWNHDGTCLASSDGNGVTIVWDARKGYADKEIELSVRE
jgi:WD40 repeat protein